MVGSEIRKKNILEVKGQVVAKLNELPLDPAQSSVVNILEQSRNPREIFACVNQFPNVLGAEIFPRVRSESESIVGIFGEYILAVGEERASAASRPTEMSPSQRATLAGNIVQLYGKRTGKLQMDDYWAQLPPAIREDAKEYAERRNVEDLEVRVESQAVELKETRKQAGIAQERVNVLERQVAAYEQTNEAAKRDLEGKLTRATAIEEQNRRDAARVASVLAEEKKEFERSKADFEKQKSEGAKSTGATDLEEKLVVAEARATAAETLSTQASARLSESDKLINQVYAHVVPNPVELAGKSYDEKREIVVAGFDERLRVEKEELGRIFGEELTKERVAKEAAVSEAKTRTAQLVEVEMQALALGRLAYLLKEGEFADARSLLTDVKNQNIPDPSLKRLHGKLADFMATYLHTAERIAELEKDKDKTPEIDSMKKEHDREIAEVKQKSADLEAKTNAFANKVKAVVLKVNPGYAGDSIDELFAGIESVVDDLKNARETVTAKYDGLKSNVERVVNQVQKGYAGTTDVHVMNALEQTIGGLQAKVVALEDDKKTGNEKVKAYYADLSQLETSLLKLQKETEITAEKIDGVAKLYNPTTDEGKTLKSSVFDVIKRGYGEKRVKQGLAIPAVPKTQATTLVLPPPEVQITSPQKNTIYVSQEDLRAGRELNALLRTEPADAAVRGLYWTTVFHNATHHRLKGFAAQRISGIFVGEGKGVEAMIYAREADILIGAPETVAIAYQALGDPLSALRTWRVVIGNNAELKADLDRRIEKREAWELHLNSVSI